MTATVFRHLNPASAAALRRLGFAYRGNLPLKTAIDDTPFAREMVQHEWWRLGSGATRDVAALLWQAPYRGGQFSSLLPAAEAGPWERRFVDAAVARTELAGLPSAQAAPIARKAFTEGRADPHLD